MERGDRFFFIQIGAHDGVTVDPIRRYVCEYHWRGLLVEPQPDVFDYLVQNYSREPQLQFVRAAIAPWDGTAELYTVPLLSGPPTVVQAMASFEKGMLVKQLPSSKQIVKVSVPTLTLKSLLGTYDVECVDLLQIDTEGYDYEIIKMIDFHRVRPAIIHYEHVHLSNYDRLSCERTLSDQGYRLHSHGLDTTAVLQD